MSITLSHCTTHIPDNRNNVERHLTFDSKKRVIEIMQKRLNDKYGSLGNYEYGLQHTIETAVKLSMDTARANPSENPSENPDKSVHLWASKTDAKKMFAKIKSEKNNLLPHKNGKIHIGELEVQDNITDYNGKIIAGLNKIIVPLTFIPDTGIDQNDTYIESNINIFRNEDLHYMNNHAKKHNMIDDDEHELLDRMIDKINPRSHNYHQNFGIVTDVKRLIILCLQQILHNDYNMYLDADIAKRLNVHDNDEIKNLYDTHIKSEQGNVFARSVSTRYKNSKKQIFTSENDALITGKETSIEHLMECIKLYADSPDMNKQYYYPENYNDRVDMRNVTDGLCYDLLQKCQSITLADGVLAPVTGRESRSTWA